MAGNQMQNPSVKMTAKVYKEASKQKRIMRTCAILQIFIGIISVVIGSFTVVVSPDNRVFFDTKPSKGSDLLYAVRTTAEGVWCGIPIVIAGGFGYSASSKVKSSPTSVKWYMILSLLTIAFMAVLISMSVFYSLTLNISAFYMGLMILQIIVGSAALATCITAAAYCLYILKTLRSDSKHQPSIDGPVICVHEASQSSITAQEAPSTSYINKHFNKNELNPPPNENKRHKVK